MTAPAQKKQRTEHVQAASTAPTGLSSQDKPAGASATAAEISQQCAASMHSSQDAHVHAAQVAESHSRGAAAATSNTSRSPADAAQGVGAHPSAPLQQAALRQEQMPDNNTILWEPLVRVIQSYLPCLLLDLQIPPQPQLQSASKCRCVSSAKGGLLHVVQSYACCQCRCKGQRQHVPMIRWQL